MRHFQAAGGYDNLIRVAQGPKQRRISQTANKTKQKKKNRKNPKYVTEVVLNETTEITFLKLYSKSCNFYKFFYRLFLFIRFSFTTTAIWQLSYYHFVYS